MGDISMKFQLRCALHFLRRVLALTAGNKISSSKHNSNCKNHLPEYRTLHFVHTVYSKPTP